MPANRRASSGHRVPGPRRRQPLFAIAALLVGLIASGCGRRPAPPPVERLWPAMGSFAAVDLPAAEALRLDAAAAIARDAVAEVEAELSSFRPGSTVHRLNEAAGSPDWLPLPGHAEAVFQLSEQAWERSLGAFDPTVGPYLHLWGFRGTNAPPVLPSAAALAEAADRVGWRLVEQQGGRARLGVEGMRLDFGGIAKGHAVDVAFERLQAAGHAAVMVNLGGNLRCSGSARTSRKGWVVAVRDPFLPYGEGQIGTLVLTDGRATATSGRYERYIEIAGRRYAHVIDPRTGQPVSGLAQISVVADSAGEADALSTALFVLGPQAGAALLRDCPGAIALFVPDPPPGERPRALASPGFLECFTPSPEWRSRIGLLCP